MLHVYLRREPWSLRTEVYIEGHSDHVHKGDVISAINFNEKGESIATTHVYEPGMVIERKPSFTMDERDIRELIQAFAVLAKEEGVRLPDESFAKGKLEAMSEHLKDMRELVFKPVEISGTEIKKHD